jgi:polysaccharide deacetylase 2 family uncharacterized protein YibQ
MPAGETDSTQTVYDSTASLKDIVFLPKPDSTKISDISASLDSALFDALTVLGVEPTLIKRSKKTTDSGLLGIPRQSLSMSFSSCFPTSLANYIFQTCFERRGCEVVSVTEQTPGKVLTLDAGHNGFTVFNITMTRSFDIKPSPAQIAIVLVIEPDCLTTGLASLLSLSEPLSFAVCPFDKKGKDMIKQVNKKKKDLMLAFSIRDKPQKSTGTDDCIYLTMSDIEIKNMLTKALSDVPEAKMVINRTLVPAQSDAKVKESFRKALLGTGVRFIPAQTGKVFIRENYNAAQVAGYVDKRESASAILDLAIFSRLDPSGGLFAVSVNSKNTEQIKESIQALKKLGFEFVPVTNMTERKATWQSKRQKSIST